MNPNANRNVLSRSLALSAILALVGLGGILPACSAQGGSADAAKAAEAPKSTGPVAEIDGKPVALAELEKAAEPQFKQLEQQKQAMLKQLEDSRHKILEGALNDLIDDKLIEAEAAKRGLSKDDLVKAEVESKLQPVTTDDVSKFYEENKARVGGRTLEQLSEQIKTYLQQQRADQTRGEFLSSLRQSHKVKILLEVQRANVEVGNAPTKGPATAPVTIVEFSDFECPFCSRVNPTLAQVREKYGDKVRIAFRQYPLPMHPKAQKAAEASLCAHDQGKFWELHDAMFANQQELAVDQLKAKAAGLGANAEQFNQCLDSGKHAKQVADDMAAGSAAGVSGTPAFFVNGRFISGAVPFEQIAPIIDDELARKGV